MDKQEYANKLDAEAQKSGYRLNPDREFVEDLASGLLVNLDRYGYASCPCRLSKGVFKEDKDIICPCDYRDEDLDEYDACFCGLYVSKKIVSGEKTLSSIPERRNKKKITLAPAGSFHSKYPVWRCTVCGYLCSRPNPPEECPICHVSKERFEELS